MYNKLILSTADNQELIHYLSTKRPGDRIVMEVDGNLDEVVGKQATVSVNLAEISEPGYEPPEMEEPLAPADEYYEPTSIPPSPKITNKMGLAPRPVSITVTGRGESRRGGLASI